MAEFKHIVTSTGFECEINPEYLDDLEVLEMLSRISSGDILVLPAYLEIMFGKEQKDALYEHLRALDGKVKLSRATGLIAEINSAIGEKK